MRSALLVYRFFQLIAFTSAIVASPPSEAQSAAELAEAQLRTCYSRAALLAVQEFQREFGPVRTGPEVDFLAQALINASICLSQEKDLRGVSPEEPINRRVESCRALTRELSQGRPGRPSSMRTSTLCPPVWNT